MTEFTIHTLDSAPDQSRALLEDSKKAFGRVPGLHAVMAEAPALLDGYKQLHRLFQQETSFDKDELPWSGRRSMSNMPATIAFPPIPALPR